MLIYSISVIFKVLQFCNQIIIISQKSYIMIRLFLAAFFCAFILFESTAGAQEMKQCSDSRLGIKIKIPKDWTQKTDVPSDTFSASRDKVDDNDTLNEYMALFITPTDGETWEQGEKDFKQLRDSAEPGVTKTLTNLKINGLKAMVYHTQGNVVPQETGGTAVLAIDLYVIMKAEKFYFISFYTTDDRYTRYKPVFEKIAKSLVII
jgi:hypothetical protein